MGNGKNETLPVNVVPVPNTINVGLGAIINVGDVTYCVKGFDTPESVLARNIKTGLDRSIKLSEISESSAKRFNGPKIDLTSIDDEDWDIAIDLYNSLQPLLECQERTQQDVKALADEHQVSVPTVYRWLARLESSGTITCLMRKKRKDSGSKRLNSLIETIIKKVIASDYLTTLKRSPTKALKEIKRQCHEKKIEPPCKSTLLRRIAEILPEEKAKRRDGRNAALDYRATRGSMPGIDRLHAIWQIDHTLVDIILVDEKDRIPIGRPWITVAIDVFSRTVVGWYISFDPPGELGTGICISSAILPKDTFLARLGVNYPWPCQGKPRIIQADNAKEFRGSMLKKACGEHGFEMKFRKVKKPNYGAHIERLLGTLLEEIHGLDGTTFSNPQEKGEYNSDENATMTLDEFEKWLANLILGPYHHDNHSTLGCPPIKKYRDGILGDENTPGIGILPIPGDPEKLQIDFLPFEERTIQPYGVVLDGIYYHDSVLDKWIGSLDPKTKRLKRKFIFRRDPRNISSLIFWDPDVCQYYRIPYRDAKRPAISLWELRAVLRYLRDKGKKEIDEDMIFKGLDEMRGIEESSRNLTKKQRMTQERRRRHERAGQPLATSSPKISDASSAKPELDQGSHAKSSNSIDYSKITPFEEIEEA